ncbi:hypothetical protein AS594_39165 [Streptomyces agglomeratus]|uniref:Uncharacterized protein n=2 Tax=Streptomyces agglomeratus TaxID=285458 RepID=A0A1E5NZ19_9ACTN|nr:hypothetical protein AS594_39165 [Streptomyces agglomeratus]
MGSEEASVRFAAALMARLFSDEQMGILRNARIEGEGGSLELSAVEELVLQQVKDNVRLMLEANPSLLTRESLTELERILVEIQGVGGVNSIEG